jgi:ppGpp synthetase/RelA/SpoT-type nucleotidyltranferase
MKMKTTPQLKRHLETNLRELQGMVNMSHSNQLTKKEMDDIARKQIVVEDIVKELKSRGVNTSELISRKFNIGGVVQAYSTPQMAGNLTGGSWGATLYELGGVVNRFTSPALLQFEGGGKIKNQYENKTAEEIWAMLSKEQRQHFLYDHKDDIENYRGEGYGELNSGEIIRAYNSNWSELDRHIKNRFANHIREGEYAGGGKIGFKGLAKKVARNYQGKTVDKKYRKEYGATYDKEEAMEVGRKVAAKVYRQQQGKMANGGKVEEWKKFVLNNKSWFDDESEDGSDDEILLTTRRHGNVGREQWGKEDVDEAKQIVKKVTSKFPDVSYEIEQVDEYVYLYFRPSKSKMANGGMAKVQILNEDEVFDKDKYKAILDDFDMDGLPNVDDPEPLKKSKNKGSVEQVQLANTFKKVLNVKQDLNIELSDFVKKLQQSAPEKSVIYGRTKTPYSILNKLVDSRLLDEKRGLKDLVGTTIAFDDIRDLQKFTEKTRKGFYGEVIDFDDFYSAPKDGYRAYHFIVKQNEVPIELQLKTKRMKDVNVLSHDAYKKKNLNTDFMLYLTTLADQADRGNKAAQVEFSKLMTNKAQVENQLNN